MTRLAVFDLDGTLLDTPTAIVATITAVLADLGLPGPDSAAVRATVGLPLDLAFGKLADGAFDESGVADAVAHYVARFRETVVPRAHELIFPQVLSGLRNLHGSGMRLAVATSKFTANAVALLEAAGLAGFFEEIIGADQVDAPKPDPEMGLLVLRRLGVPAHRTVMVGDTTHDLLMAHGAGMSSIAVTYGVHDEQSLRSAGPTWLAHSFDDVVLRLRHAGKDVQ